MFTLVVKTQKYGTFTETVDSLEGARIRAAAIYGNCDVTIVGPDGKMYRRFA